MKDYDTLQRRIARKFISILDVGTVLTVSEFRQRCRDSGCGLISAYTALPLLEWLEADQLVKRVTGPDARKLYFAVCQPPCVRNRSSHREQIVLLGGAKCTNQEQRGECDGQEA